MVNGFVFGKFHPFHKGHEAMIRFALQHCDALTVLVCCSDRETIPCDIRANWIRETFAGEPNVNVVTYRYSEADLPNTSESSVEVSKIWSKIFLELLPDHELLVTSEPYGEFVAEFMGIRHIGFDLNRQLFPVSATAIRSDLLANWEYLPESVKPYFCIKVAILGTESTGKTMLATALAKHYGCGLVLEAARGIVENSNAFSISDLQAVVTAHTSNIQVASHGVSPLIVVDTNLYTTLSYSLFSLEQELQVSAADVATNRADLCIYLSKDAPYFQDGTRLSEVLRDRLDDSHRKVLRERRIDFVEIGGNWNQRFFRSTQLIDQLLKDAHNRF